MRLKGSQHMGATALQEQQMPFSNLGILVGVYFDCSNGIGRRGRTDQAQAATRVLERGVAMRMLLALVLLTTLASAVLCPAAAPGIEGGYVVVVCKATGDDP
jgi:hypothetical protein